MKKLLVIVNVFGKYQDYIPLFCLSWLRAYPYVDIRIYLNDTINTNVQKQLEMLDVLNHVTIIENSVSLVGLTEKATKYPQISKCIRWLLYEPVFEEYEALYNADLDVIIAKEEESLFDQHIRHCDYLGFPYSNVKRSVHFPHPLKPYTLARNLYRAGIRNSLRHILQRERTLYKLSGWHFVKPVEYFSAVRRVSGALMEELNRLGEGKSKSYNNCTFNNEIFLHDMVKASGLGVTDDVFAIVGSDGFLQITAHEQNPETEFFRPHHGIHLGIFRRSQTIDRYTKLLDSEVYHTYYEDFCELAKTDEYKYLSEQLPPFVSEQIHRFHEYYIQHGNTLKP